MCVCVCVWRELDAWCGVQYIMCSIGVVRRRGFQVISRSNKKVFLTTYIRDIQGYIIVVGVFM